MGLARLNHPAHKAMVVMFAGAGVGSVPGYHGQGLFYIGGVVPLAWTWWYLEFGNSTTPICRTESAIPRERSLRCCIPRGRACL